MIGVPPAVLQHGDARRAGQCLGQPGPRQGRDHGQRQRDAGARLASSRSSCGVAATASSSRHHSVATRPASAQRSSSSTRSAQSEAAPPSPRGAGRERERGYGRRRARQIAHRAIIPVPVAAAKGPAAARLPINSAMIRAERAAPPVSIATGDRVARRRPLDRRRQRGGDSSSSRTISTRPARPAARRAAAARSRARRRTAPAPRGRERRGYPAPCCSRPG